MSIKSEYLDVAIALAVVFFLASLIVSGLNEGIQWATRVRAKFLWAYLHDLTSKGPGAKALPKGWKGIADLKGHDKRPTVEPPAAAVDPADPPDVLTRLGRALDPIDAPQLTGTSKKTAISYVPSASLAQAFLEVFADIGREPLDQKVRALVEALVRGGSTDPLMAELSSLVGEESADRATVETALATFKTSLQAAQTDDAAEAAGRALGTTLQGLPDAKTGVPGGDLPQVAAELARAVRAAREAPDDVPTRTLARAEARKLSTAIIRSLPDRFGARERIETAMADLDGSPIASTARRLWEAAKNDIDEFRTGLEKWFESEMTRLGGYYKRSIRVVLAVLAFLVVVTLNIDSLQLARDLWRNPQGRTELVAQADELVGTTPAKPPAAPGSATPTSPGIATIQQRCAEAHPTSEAETATPEGAAEALGKVRTCVNDALNKMSGLNVIDRPIWKQDAWRSDWTKPNAWLLHPLGLLGTMIALTLGAPFWFQLLKRLSGLRSDKAPRT